VARLDTMVTVVDAFNFLRDYGSPDSLGQRGQSLGDEDTRTVVDLLIEQIEFCDVLVVNKTDLVTPEERERLMAILQSLNPRARIEVSQFGRVALDRVLDTGLFDFEQAEQAPGWLAELRGEHVPESEAYGIRSFVYRSRLPFHPKRFWDLVQSEWEGVVRSKGFFWLASRATRAGSWSQAGGACRYGARASGGRRCRGSTGRPSRMRWRRSRKTGTRQPGMRVRSWYSSASAWTRPHCVRGWMRACSPKTRCASAPRGGRTCPIRSRPGTSEKTYRAQSPQVP
jgi:G3E family GTPase